MEMTRPRTELQELLENILGSENVYFQPLPDQKLKYPCIVYSLNTYSPNYANNSTYIRRTRYTLILIYKNSYSEFTEELANIQYCRHTRHYVEDNLSHDVYDLYW